MNLPSFREFLAEELPAITHVDKGVGVHGNYHSFKITHPKLSEPMVVTFSKVGNEGRRLDIQGERGNNDYHGLWYQNANKLGPAGVRHVVREIHRHTGITHFSGGRTTGAKAATSKSLAAIRLKEALGEL